MTPEEIRLKRLADYDNRFVAFFNMLREAVALFAEYVALKREEAAKPPAPPAWPLTVPPANPVFPLPLVPNTVPYPNSPNTAPWYPNNPTYPIVTCGEPTNVTQPPKLKWTCGPENAPTLCQSNTNDHSSGLAVKDQDQKVETLADRSQGCYTNDNPWGTSGK